MRLVRTLIDEGDSAAHSLLPRALLELYDGDLHFPAAPVQRPYIIGNFASTLDGVVSYGLEGRSGGSTISGSNPADRFIMGLLRASVDAVVVGAATVRDTPPEALWVPEYTYPAAKDLYADYRLNALHKVGHPLVAVVTGSGKLDLDRAIFRTPGVQTLVITTPAGRNELAKAGAEKSRSIEIRAVGAPGSRIAASAIAELLHAEFGVRTLLHEGGPTLFGTFLAEKEVDELFMTVVPQIAGRVPGEIRPGLVEGVEFLPETAPWFLLVSAKENAGQLFLRYRRNGMLQDQPKLT